MSTRTLFSRLVVASSGVALAAVLTLGGCPAKSTGPAVKTTTPVEKAAPVKNGTATMKGAKGAATSGATKTAPSGATPDNPAMKKVNGAKPDAKKDTKMTPAPIDKGAAAKAPVAH